MGTLKTVRLMAYLSIISFLYINGSCGTKDDPAPAVPQAPPTQVTPTLPEGAAIQITQAETGLWADSKSDRMDPQFNQSGQLIGLFLTRQGGGGNSTGSTIKCAYGYNTDGFVTTRKTTIGYSTGGSQQLTSTENFEYQNGRLSRVNMVLDYENFRSVPEYTLSKFYQYDAKGNLTQYRKVDKNGAEIERYEYSYDGNGKMTSSREYTAGVLNPDVEYVYTNGLSTKRTVKSKGVVQWISENTYNTEGQPIKYTVSYPATGYGFYWTFTYDDKKVPIDLMTFFASNYGGGIRSDYLFFKGHPDYPFWSLGGYDKHNLLSVTDSNPLGRQQTYAYQYNSQGYPTEVTYSIYNGTQKATTNGKRTYTYFK